MLSLWLLMHNFYCPSNTQYPEIFLMALFFPFQTLTAFQRWNEHQKTELQTSQTLEYRTSNTFEQCSNQTCHFGQKTNFKPLKHHQKSNCLRTLLIKNGSNSFLKSSKMNFEYVILAKNRTSNLLNIIKNRTVCQHLTVRSTSTAFAATTLV